MNPIKVIVGKSYRWGKMVVIWASDSMLAHKACAGRFSIDAYGGFCYFKDDKIVAFGESESLGTSIDGEKEYLASLDLSQFKMFQLLPNMLNTKDRTSVLVYIEKPDNEDRLEMLVNDNGEIQDVVDAEDFGLKLKFLLEEARDVSNAYTRRTDGW